VDTTAWVALYDRSDKSHDRASEYWNRLRKRSAELWTSDYILDETLTLLRMRAGHRGAVLFGESVRSSGLKVLEVAREVRESAWEIFVRYEDKDFSFTDCTSFALMRDMSLRKAFAFDRHFTQFGLEMVP
jgi:hypothetical protein